jgi:hypothetical protein
VGLTGTPDPLSSSAQREARAGRPHGSGWVLLPGPAHEGEKIFLFPNAFFIQHKSLNILVKILRYVRKLWKFFWR